MDVMHAGTELIELTGIGNKGLVIVVVMQHSSRGIYFETRTMIRIIREEERDLTDFIRDRGNNRADQATSRTSFSIALFTFAHRAMIYAANLHRVELRFAIVFAIQAHSRAQWGSSAVCPLESSRARAVSVYAFAASRAWEQRVAAAFPPPARPVFAYCVPCDLLRREQVCASRSCWRADKRA